MRKVYPSHSGSSNRISCGEYHLNGRLKDDVHHFNIGKRWHLGANENQVCLSAKIISKAATGLVVFITS